MKVSIFTPTHDSSFLRRVYESIRDQDFYEWVIIYNNGQQRIGFDDERVKEIVLEKTDAKNGAYVGYLKHFACAQCKGDILLELDHDDLLLPNAVAEVKSAFEKNPHVGFVYSNCVTCNGDYSKRERYAEGHGWQYRDYTFEGHELDEYVAFAPTPASISKIWGAPNHLRAFRRSVYEEVGGYNQGMEILDDLDLMCRLYLVTTFFHIDKPLYLYRVTGQNTWLVPRIMADIQNLTWVISDRYLIQLAEKWAKEHDLLLVELGGKTNARKDFTTVDLKDADITFDLNGDWPFADESVGVVRAYDVFEHLRDPIHSMKELYRVLAPGGYAFLQIPSTDGRGAFQDPTHVSFWNENSFLYYTNKGWNRWIDCDVRFQAIRLITTPKDNMQVCWVMADLIKIDPDVRVQGRQDI